MLSETGTIETIKVENLTVRFSDILALDKVNHTFEPGTATAIIGVNGSGKTTMLECLAGLQKPSEGRISGVSENVAFVCQHPPSCWMPITAGEVLTMGRYGKRGLLGWLKADDRAAVQQAAELLNVKQLCKRSFSELSGGQQQRVRIAQALASEPDVILLDEPLTGLDIPSQERILDVIETYASRSAIVIISTHHLDEARHCDSVVLLANRVVASGTPDEMLTEPLLRETFGDRLLGDHAKHDHNQELIVLDDHGHHDHSHGQRDHGRHPLSRSHQDHGPYAH